MKHRIINITNTQVQILLSILQQGLEKSVIREVSTVCLKEVGIFEKLCIIVKSCALERRCKSLSSLPLFSQCVYASERAHVLTHTYRPVCYSFLYGH